MTASSIFSFDQPVVLLGGGVCVFETLENLLAQAYPLIVADGGANHLFEHPLIVPDLIIGDLDSLQRQSYWESKTRVVEVKEQDSTDFEKCLYTVEAPLYLAIGFTGKRIDHTLAALHVIAKYSAQKQVVLVSEEDVVFVCRQSLGIKLPAGMRFSIFPIETVSFQRSSGLLYPLDGLTLSPMAMIGTSNEVQEESIVIETEPGDDAAWAVILPINALTSLREHLCA